MLVYIQLFKSATASFTLFYIFPDFAVVREWRESLLHHLAGLVNGGFFLACEDFGRIFDHSFPACAFVVVVVVVVVLMEISSHTLIPLFTPGSGYSGSASGDDCGRLFPD